MKPELPDEDLYTFANPSKELQEKFVWRSFVPAYVDGLSFVNYVTLHGFREDLPRRVLDFGCGWGRMSCLLMQHPAAASIEFHGCDVSELGLDLVRRSVPRLWIQPCAAYPPTAYRDACFDVVYANSVFSHLDEDCAQAWGREFARILRPGGCLVVTTQGMKFLNYVQSLARGKIESQSQKDERLIELFAADSVREDYVAGRFVYGQTYPNRPNYGEALVPRAWFDRVWGALGFRVADWDETGNQNQCALTLRA